jgi:hypothetical protein
MVFKRKRIERKDKYTWQTLRFERCCDLPKNLNDKVGQHVLSLELVEIICFVYNLNLQKQAAYLQGFGNQNGVSWNECYSFIRRHKIILRQPKVTPFSRTRSFVKAKVCEFFIFSQIIPQNNIGASCIYGIDKSGLSTLHKPQKILARKGKRHVGNIKMENGRNHTT